MTEDTKKIIEYKKKFLDYYHKNSNPEITEMVDHILMTDHFYMANCNFQYNYENYEVHVKVDDKNEFPYVIERGQKVFFPRKYNEQEVKGRFISLLKEQDVFSPHRYLDDDSMDVIREAKNQHKKIVVLELGAMEGMFSLSLADIVDEIYLFECDTDWITVLKETFKPWKEKVTISDKKVCEYSDEYHTALDDWNFDISDNLFLIVKIDIEGDERYALNGMRKLLAAAEDFLLFVCTYHKKDDERLVREMFKDNEIRNNKGYFCFYVADDYDEPYIRRCVLKIKKVKR